METRRLKNIAILILLLLNAFLLLLLGYQYLQAEEAPGTPGSSSASSLPPRSWSCPPRRICLSPPSAPWS